MKCPHPDDFSGMFYPTFKRELAPILHNVLQKRKRKQQSPFHEGGIALTPKACTDGSTKGN